jgi:hypothetical protein
VAELVQQHRAEQADHEAEPEQVAAGDRQVEVAADELAVDEGDQRREQQDRGVEVERHAEHAAQREAGPTFRPAATFVAARRVSHRVDATEVSSYRSHSLPP